MNQTVNLPYKLDKPVISFIGAGNMTRSLVHGILQNHDDAIIRVADPDNQQLDHFCKTWEGIETTNDNHAIIQGADVVVMSVKPQIMQTVAEDLTHSVQQYKPLVLSIAAGVTTEKLNTWLGGQVPLVRCMPNTPSLVQSGASGLYANSVVSDEQKNLAEHLMRAVGLTLWFEEENSLDIVTAVSGSGPAYFFLVMEAMQAAGEALGLKEQDAYILTLQTAFGAAKLALESGEKPAELRQRVTSKGGTTEAALNQLINGGLPDLFQTALSAAKQRAEALAEG
jgi:pyrroline-5-carboxylate reductase